MRVASGWPLATLLWNVAMSLRSLAVLLLMAVPAPVGAQEMSMPMSMPMEHRQQDDPKTPLGIPMTRDGSGTSWLPTESRMQGAMREHGPWTLMVHGNGFLQFLDAGSERGDRQFGSTNWIMAMAQRAMAGGQFTARAMFSADPATVGRCGYPNLLQTGESCRGERLHDQQHPHDVFMELALDYRRELASSLAFEVYGGPSGDPALGPTAYPHRPSAMPNPLAPITHHWLDASHISFGVVTGAVYGPRWKAEGSVFNGREPDDRRANFDFGAMDSVSGRLWLMPTARWAIQVSAARLIEGDAHGPGVREDVTRVTASATYHRMVNQRLWATTIAVGWNRESTHSSPGLLAETAADVTTRDTVFARGEVVSKTAADLVVPDVDATFTVTKVGIGYTRWLPAFHGIQTGIGGGTGVALLPPGLRAVYGGRTAGEFSVVLTVRGG